MVSYLMSESAVKEMEKKKREPQKSIVKIENVSKVDRIDGSER